MLDGQTPYVEIIAYRGDDIVLRPISKVPKDFGQSTYDEAAVDTDTQSQAHQYKSYLICPVTKSTRPQPHEWSYGINHCKSQRYGEHVVHWENRIFRKVCNYDLADGIGVDQPHVEYEGYEVVVQYDGLEEEVQGNKGPGGEVWNQAVERGFNGLLALATNFHDVYYAAQSVSSIALQQYGVAGRRSG